MQFVALVFEVEKPGIFEIFVKVEEKTLENRPCVTVF